MMSTQAKHRRSTAAETRPEVSTLAGEETKVATHAAIALLGAADEVVVTAATATALWTMLTPKVKMPPAQVHLAEAGRWADSHPAVQIYRATIRNRMAALLILASNISIAYQLFFGGPGELEKIV